MTTLKTSSRSRPTLAKSLRAKPKLVGSATSAERELTVLRRGRERLAAKSRPDESSARTSIAARRVSKV